MVRWCPWLLSKFLSLSLKATRSNEIRKRQNPNEEDSLPTELLEIWTPLLESVTANHPTFPNALVMNIVNTLLYGKHIADADEISRKDKSYGQCIARWAVFVVDRWGANQNPAATDDGKAYLAREDVVATLLTALGSSEIVESSERTRQRRQLIKIVHKADFGVPVQPTFCNSLARIDQSCLSFQQNFFR